jgi:hypothetical protein
VLCAHMSVFIGASWNYWGRWERCAELLVSMGLSPLAAPVRCQDGDGLYTHMEYLWASEVKRCGYSLWAYWWDE